MTFLSKEDREATIDAALKRIFGDLLDWERPKLLHEFGPNDLKDVDDFENRLRKTLDNVRAAFDEMTDDVIQDIGSELEDAISIRECD